MSLTWRPYRWLPVALAALAVAVAAFALLPVLKTLAQDPLGVFRVKRFAAVSIDPSALLSTAKGDPTALGSLTVYQMPTRTTLPTLQEAQPLVDFPLRSPRALPDSLGAAPEIGATGEGRFSYTFDLQKARQFLATLGATAAGLPENLEGATIKVTIPPQVVAQYGGQDGAGASLLLSQGRSPVLEAPPGLDLEGLRRQVLALPGLPPELTSQLQAIQDWQHTAVVPLPKDRAGSKIVPVDGVEGLYVEETSGKSRSLLWEKDGVIYGMAGGLGLEDLLSAANSLTP